MQTSDVKLGRKLIVLGQVPPPSHGQSIAIQAMVQGLSGQLDLIHVPMRFSETVFDNGRMGLHKLRHLVSLIYMSLRLLIRYPGSILYYPPAPASWVPIVRDLLILSLLRPFAAKTVFHFHAHGIGEFIESHRWLSIIGWCWKRPDYSIVLGESCKDDAEKIGSKHLAVIPYGIELAPDPKQKSKKDKFVVLYVGMLAESKGIFDLLSTASKLKDLNIEFRLVGTYKYNDTQSRFEAMRAQLHLDDTVITVGFRSGDDLWDEYKNADIFFFPTFYEAETFGIVVLEAMAHRLPVVASDWRGPKDIVRHGITGFLCSPRDIESYAAAIRQLLEDSDLRDCMGCEGCSLYGDSYTLKRFLQSMNDVFVSAGCQTLRGH